MLVLALVIGSAALAANLTLLVLMRRSEAHRTAAARQAAAEAAASAVLASLDAIGRRNGQEATRHG